MKRILQVTAGSPALVIANTATPAIGREGQQ
jgi:hypothetical protein